MRFPSWRDWEESTIRERPVGLIVIAALSALGAAWIVASAIELFAGAAAYQDWTVPKLVGNDQVGMVTVYPEHYLVVGAILLVPALYLAGFALAIARSRPIAWVLGIVTGGLVLLYGILALVIPGDAAADADRWHPGASLPFIAIGALLLWYFQRRSTRYDLGWGDPAIG